MADEMRPRLRAKSENHAEPENTKTIQDSSQEESSARNQLPPLKSVCLRGPGPSFASRKEAMPEPSNGGLFPVAPGKMAILAVKLFGNNFEGAKDPNKRRSHEFSSHLRILDIRRPALRAPDKGRGDIGISRLPLDHQILGTLEISVFHHDLRIGLWAGHEANLLQRGFIVNIRAQPRILEATL
jgi:hypothetical protein